MRMISVKKLTSGMQLAKPVFSADGRILLQKNVILNNRYIKRLSEKDCTYVYIQDRETYDIDIDETVSPQIRQEVVYKVKLVFDKVSDPETGPRIIQSGEIFREFSNLFKLLLDCVMENPTFVSNLSSIYTSDAFLYTHCMNVGVLASVLGMANGYKGDKLKQFGLGAMLHDIGKLLIPGEILNKPGLLTDDERQAVEQHCQLGYDILVKQPELSAVSAHCALQHHEKYDGTGYPWKLKGNEIHEFGRLLAVPDVFDAMTSNRVYRKSMLPHEALEYMYANSGSHFDPSFVQLFVRHVNIYPNGVPIALSDGTAGVVARMNRHNLQRPVVLILEEEGHKVPTPYEVDLSTALNLTITACGVDDEGPLSSVV